MGWICEGCKRDGGTMTDVSFWVCGCGHGNSKPGEVTFSEHQLLIYFTGALEAAPHRAEELQKIILDQKYLSDPNTLKEARKAHTQRFIEQVNSLVLEAKNKCK